MGSTTSSLCVRQVPERGHRIFFAILALAVLLFLSAALFFPGRALADGGQVAHSSSGSDAYTSISDAMAAANSGTAIVMDADWELDSHLEVTGSSVTIMMNGHKIYHDTSMSSAGNLFSLAKSSTLTLSGEGASTTFSYTGFVDGELDSRSELTVTSGGLLTGGHCSSAGGAIYMQEGSTLNLINVAIAGNKCYSSDGGAIEVSGAYCTINMTDSTIEHNAAASGSLGRGYGGGIHSSNYTESSNTVINMSNSSISYNYATNCGGLYFNSPDNTINMKDNSKIDHNGDVGSSSSDGGGGLYFCRSRFKIVGDGTASISYNYSVSQHGGGISTDTYSGESWGAISKVTFEGNCAMDDQGGAIYLDQSNITISKCTFNDNSSKKAGGAVYLNGSDCTLSDCTFTKNYTFGDDGYDGGAIYNNSKNDLLQGCTITDNECTGEGGGVFSNWEDNIYLRGVVNISGNTRKNGTADDLFLDSTSGENIWAYVVAGSGNDVSAGSYVGIRTGNSGTREVVTKLSNYIPGTYFLDDTSFHLRYDSDDQKLYQEGGSASTYQLMFNRQSLGEARSGVTLHIDAAKCVADGQAFLGWDAQSFSGLPNAADIVAGARGSAISFTMPSNDVTLAAKVVTRISSVKLELTAPVPGQALPEQATLIYTPVGGEQTSKSVPVSWSKVVDGQSTPASGTVEFATTYVATVTVAQDYEGALAFALDMGIDGAPLYLDYGDGVDTSVSRTASASVNKSSGTLTVTSQPYTTRDRAVTSVEPLAAAVQAGTSPSGLVAAVPATASATGEDGTQVQLPVDVAGIEWAKCVDADGNSILGEHGMNAAPAGGELTRTFTVSVNLSAPEGVDLPESLSTTTLSVVVSYPNRTVTFQPGNGQESWTQTVGWGGTASKPEPDPTWEGHAFKGWYAEGATKAYDFEAAVTQDVTLVAKWEANSFTVTFEPGNGQESWTQTVAWGETALRPEGDPSWEGHVFKGWYAEGASEAYDFGTTVTGNLTLHAQWEPETYTVTFLVDDSTYATQSVEYGACASAPQTAPAKEGHSFQGWIVQGASEAYDFTSPVKGNLTLCAQWSVNTCRVTFTVDGSEYEVREVEYGSPVAPEKADPTKDGYTFQGWYADEALSKAYDFTAAVTSDLTLYAKWVETPAPAPDPEPTPDPEPEPTPDPAPTSFSDVTYDKWYYGWVKEAASRGLMSGYKDADGKYTGLFGPEDSLTRAQVATVIWRMAGSPEAAWSGKFPDVAEGAWYTQAVEWCAAQGIVTGYTGGANAGTFQPDGYVTREELAVMVYRYAKSAGAVSADIPTANFDRCQDTASVACWSRDAMVWCAAACVITGKQLPEGYFLDPQAGATRAEAAKVLVQADRLAKQEIDPYSLDELIEEGAEAEVQAQLLAAVEDDSSDEATFDDVSTPIETTVTTETAAEGTQGVPAEEGSATAGEPTSTGDVPADEATFEEPVFEDVDAA